MDTIDGSRESGLMVLAKILGMFLVMPVVVILLVKWLAGY